MGDDNDVVGSYCGFKNRGFAATPLAEVFSVIIQTRNGEECQLYGTIEVKDCNGTLLIYDEKQEDPDTINDNGRLHIINEERAISGEDPFTVYFNLWQVGDDSDIVFINGSINWNGALGYDKGICAEVLGEHGSAKATIYYIVYEVAMEANIWVHYEKDESASSNTVEACGRVTVSFKERYDWPKANIHNEYNEYREITIFEYALCELDDEHFLKLSRSVIVVSFFHSLIIAVDLKGLGDGEQLWKGEVEFFPNEIILEHTCEEINGKHGVLGVNALGFHYLESLKCVDSWKKAFRNYGTMP